MKKIYTSLGFMSGTSGDGIDVSIIKSDGYDYISKVINRYYPYKSISTNIKEELNELKKIIINPNDLTKYQKRINYLEEQITFAHNFAYQNIIKDLDFFRKNQEISHSQKDIIESDNIEDLKKIDINLIGFHGQTIFHDAKSKLTKQIGNGRMLSKLTKKTVIYDFRSNDIKNDGEGAPLTPIYHQLIFKRLYLEFPIFILNLGGITNLTILQNQNKISLACDIGPGNCLIDEWIKKKTSNDFDFDGEIASKGKVNNEILTKALEKYFIKQNLNTKINNNNFTEIFNAQRSFGLQDFDLNFVKGLSKEDGAATLTEYTTSILARFINTIISSYKDDKIRDKINIVLCGGGRKNYFLRKTLSKKINKKLLLIEEITPIFGQYNGDFIESQAFAYLAIRSKLKLPISFPQTTGCKSPSTGGLIVKNF